MTTAAPSLSTSITLLVTLGPWMREPDGTLIRAWRLDTTRLWDLGASVQSIGSALGGLLGPRWKWQAWAPFSHDRLAFGISTSRAAAQREAEEALKVFCAARVS